MRRDLPKQTGALNRAHVTFVTYAYNPVFKDRAGLAGSEEPVQYPFFPIQKRCLAARSVFRQGAETYASVLLPSTSLLAFVTGACCSPVLNGQAWWTMLVPAPRLPETVFERAAIYVMADAIVNFFFRPCSLRTQLAR